MISCDSLPCDGILHDLGVVGAGVGVRQVNNIAYQALSATFNLERFMDFALAVACLVPVK